MAIRRETMAGMNSELARCIAEQVAAAHHIATHEPSPPSANGHPAGYRERLWLEDWVIEEVLLRLELKELPEYISSKIGPPKIMGYATPCWPWIAAKTNGYGVVQYAGRIRRAHRVIYGIMVGAIPDKPFLLHSCDNPCCVNPDHLRPGTNQDNVDDMMSRGRHISGGTHTDPSSANYERGETHHAAKLTAETVRAMRTERECGDSFGAISRRHDIAIGHVFRIVTRKAWAHVI